MADLTGDVVLPSLRVEGRASRPSLLTGQTTLPMLVAQGTLAPAQGMIGRVTLKMLRVKGRIQPVVHTLHGNTKLRSLRSHLSIRAHGRIIFLTGKVYASGSTFLSFIGPPDRTVRWSVVEGGGAVIPVTDYTDQWGRAAALYQAGGYTGKVVVRVEYGS